MTVEQNPIREQLNKSIESIRAVRDEIKVQAHLLGMEAKDKWRDLESQIESAELRARTEATAAVQSLTQELLERAKRFKEGLSSKQSS